MRWYQKLAVTRGLWPALLTSLQVAAFSTGVALVLGTLCAIALVRGRFAGRDSIATFLISPLMLPGLIAGAVTAFAAGLGEFGAVITFAANVPGITRTIPLALYTAIQSAGGDDQALRLAILSFILGLIGLVLAEALARRARSLVGR